MKATSEELLLVQRLTDEPLDPTATSQLFGQYYTLLINTLVKKFPNVDVDVIREVVFNTLDKFVEQVHKFDPERNSLINYLKMDAMGDVKNILPKYSKEKKSMISVEDWDTHRNTIDEELSNESMDQILVLAGDKLQEIFPISQDLELAKMVICKVKSTSQYINLLGIENMSYSEQQAIVKQHKDRIKKVLDRKGWNEFKEKIKNQFL